MYLGSWKIDDLLTFTVVTTRVDTGAATDADSVPTYRVYEDETATPLLTGSMALLDSANTAGFYSEQITLSAANGFEKGKSYNIYITATVNSIAGATVRNFQMEAEVDANRVNWANVDNPSTTVGLSGTTVKTATDVETDTADIQSRLPAALTGAGNIKADALAISGDTVAADNLEAAADGTTYNLGGGAVVAASVTGAVGSVTGNVGGNVTGSVGSVATGGIAAASFAAGAIDAAAIAANAIGASELAADAVTEIQSGLSTLDAAGVRTALGLASANLDTQLGDLPTNAELATSQAAADDATLAAIAALNNLSAAQVNAEVVDALATDIIADSVPADGTRPTIAQALYMITQFLMEKSVSSTTVTVKKVDGSTSLLTLTLDDASNPTSITRAS